MLQSGETMTLVRQEGFSSKQNIGPFVSDVLDANAIAQLLGKRMSQLGNLFAQNTEHYVNARVQKGRTPEPKYILSSVGLVDHPQKFGWAWLPPNRGVYTILPQGQIRPWSYIFLHSYGYMWDLSYLRRNRQRRFCPGDVNGYHPTRWYAGLRQLCSLNTDPQKKRQGGASIHFCISRRGDVVVSVDVNDIAWHGGGIQGVDTPFTPKGNNYYSIGFELEPALARYKYSNGSLSNPMLLPYSDRQMLALAIVCKKLVTYRNSIREVYLTKQNGSMRAQANKYGSGYLTHKDVNSNKSDPGAQFDILPGETGVNNANPWMQGLKSGWDQLWDLMRPMRFSLATDIFVKDVTANITKDLANLSTAMMKNTNKGQQTVIQRQRDNLTAFKRAFTMQAQTRRDIYKSATNNATTMIDIAAKNVTNIVRQVQRFDASNIKGVGGSVQSFDFETGTWKVGGVDTKKAI